MAKKTFREKISGIADQALNGVKKAATHKTKITRELIMNPPIAVGGLNEVSGGAGKIAKEALNAWGQDAKTAKYVRKFLKIQKGWAKVNKFPK